MKSLFWAAINLIGFVILVFIYSSMEKTKRNTGQKLLRCLNIAIMLYLIIDTGMYLVDRTTFPGAVKLNYIFSMFYYLLVPFPGVIYFLYCDFKIFNDAAGLKKRMKLYLIPAAVSVLAVLSSPLTHIVFYIDENNMYTRGSLFWIAISITFLYILASYPILLTKTMKKSSSPNGDADIYLYLAPLPPLVFGIFQLVYHGPLLVGLGFIASAYYLFSNNMQSADKSKLSVKFSRILIAQFAVIAFIMITGMLLTFENILSQSAQDHSIIRTKLLLPFGLIIFLFIIFVFSTNRITQVLIFTPIKSLVDSLIRMKESRLDFESVPNEIYGSDRDDEIGLLSNTIQDLFIKGYYDGLTGIYNRRYLERTLQQVITTFSRTESTLSVMMVDIDFFKKYNDTYGHSKGDECLRLIAQTLNKSIVRKGDFAARYGGEEFAIILPNADEAGAKIIGERMLQAIRDLKISHEKNPGGIVTVSIGITTGNFIHTLSWDDYINKSDEALYLSKQNGRNRTTFLALT
ncbi:MAG: GGDEF domain-containing protein [Treponema sp.]|nr:GGDEF domain-containing protein [Treponema sp.]